MEVLNEAKKLTRSKWFYLFVGILLGGTALAYPVSRIVGWSLARFRALKSGAAGVANKAAGAVTGK